jgi:hypothetical protein
MASVNSSARSGPTDFGLQQAVEKMAELIRDLHELLESYAPTWYTEDLDSRVSETLAMIPPARTPSDGLWD